MKYKKNKTSIMSTLCQFFYKLKYVIMYRRHRRVVQQIRHFELLCSTQPSVWSKFRVQLCRGYNWLLETVEMQRHSTCCLSVGLAVSYIIVIIIIIIIVMQKVIHLKTAKIMNSDITWARYWHWQDAAHVISPFMIFVVLDVSFLQVAVHLCINCSFVHLSAQ